MDVSCIRCVERARFWTKITSEIERSIPTIILLKLKEISECLTFVIGLSEYIEEIYYLTFHTKHILHVDNRITIRL